MPGVNARLLVWRGSKKLEPQPDSPKFRQDKGGPVWTYAFAGPYAVVLAAKPQRLATFRGLPLNFFIDTVALDKAPGGRGILTLTATPSPAEGIDSAGLTTSSPVVEVEWVEIQKKLETHPRYNDGGAKALTDQDRNDIEMWRDGRDAVLRTAFKYKAEDESTKTLSDNAQDFAAKILRGTDSYVIYVPLVRVTTKSRGRPPTAKCGIRSRPSEGAVNGYLYLRTADRRTRQEGSWTRVQEWTGADLIDADLYPAT